MWGPCPIVLGKKWRSVIKKILNARRENDGKGKTWWVAVNLLPLHHIPILYRQALGIPTEVVPVHSQASSLQRGDSDATQVFPTPPAPQQDESEDEDEEYNAPANKGIRDILQALRGGPRPPWEAPNRKFKEAFEAYPSDSEDSCYYDVPVGIPVPMSQSQ